MGIKNRVFLEPRRDADFDVIDPVSGTLRVHLTLRVGEQFELKGGEAFVLEGSDR
jgi:hypothetical protein